MSSTAPDRVPDRLLILGGSARGAAMSALRAGFTPVCGDMFGDEDLRAIAETHVVSDYPRGLIDVANAVPPCNWLYTGAVENSPRLIARISRRHRLLGNPPSVLRFARDPFHIAGILRRAGLPFLAPRRANDPPDSNGGWLLKPRRSAGGRAIRLWDATSAASHHSPLVTHHSPTYFQEYATGTPISAVFVATRLNCRLVGTTRQLVGEEELHAPPFAYCGSLGPLRLPDELTRQIERIGRVLADECGLRGLFGIDGILRGGTVAVTEVNPRYTASVEVFELADGRPLLAWHQRACESFADHTTVAAVESELSREATRTLPASGSRPIVGKAILFAPMHAAEFTVPPLHDALPPVEIRGGVSPAVADVPRPGSLLRGGDPICTIFASGATVAECLNALFARVRTLHLSPV